MPRPCLVRRRRSAPPIAQKNHPLDIMVFGKRQHQEREGGSEDEDTTTSSIQLFSLIRLGLFYVLLFPFFIEVQKSWGKDDGWVMGDG